MENWWSGNSGFEGGGPGRRSGRESFSFSAMETASDWEEERLKEGFVSGFCGGL